MTSSQRRGTRKFHISYTVTSISNRLMFRLVSHRPPSPSDLTPWFERFRAEQMPWLFPSRMWKSMHLLASRHRSRRNQPTRQARIISASESPRIGQDRPHDPRYFAFLDPMVSRHKYMQSSTSIHKIQPSHPSSTRQSNAVVPVPDRVSLPVLSVDTWTSSIRSSWKAATGGSSPNRLSVRLKPTLSPGSPVGWTGGSRHTRRTGYGQ
jgi:hypothetical protein